MRGFTQEKLAELVDVHVNTVIRWENGTRDPRVSELKRLSEVLDCTESDLLNGPARQEFEVKIVMGVKNLTGLAGVEVASNSFIFGVQDDEPQIVLAGKVRINTPEERENALAEIVKKFKAACWMFDHKEQAEGYAPDRERYEVPAPN